MIQPDIRDKFIGLQRVMSMPLSMGLERVRWLSYKHKEWKREPSKWKSGQTEFGLVNSSEVSVLVILSIVFLSVLSFTGYVKGAPLAWRMSSV